MTWLSERFLFKKLTDSSLQKCQKRLKPPLPCDLMGIFLFKSNFAIRRTKPREIGNKRREITCFHTIKNGLTWKNTR